MRRTDKRREDYSKPPETFHAEQVMALARAAREGKHVNGGRRWASAEEDPEQQRFNEQDAALYVVAGFTGLRQGELRALRWRHVRFEDPTLVVVAAMSAGVEGSTKSGKWRAVPLTREAFVVLDELSRRDWFTGPDDFVFCGPAGDPIDDSALRRRYRLARDAAGLPPLPFHHLRHTYQARSRSRRTRLPPDDRRDERPEAGDVGTRRKRRRVPRHQRPRASLNPARVD